jgi:hypothetical protein
MAWSDARRLKDYFDAPNRAGVYEIGFVHGGLFRALYLGMADDSIRTRLSSHYNGSGNQQVKEYYLKSEKDNLYCHWMQVSDPGATEARMLARLKIGKDGGLYSYNNKYEPAPTRS